MLGTHSSTDSRDSTPHRFHLTPLLVLVLCTACFCVMVALTLLVQSRSHALEMAIRENLNTTRLANLYVRHLLQTSTALLNNVATLTERQGLAHFASKEGLALLTNLVRKDPGVQSILLLDAAGQIIVSTNSPFPLPQAIDCTDREYFIRHKNGEYLVFGEQLIGRTSTRRTTPISRAIRAPDGALLGVVVVTIEASMFSDLFREAEYSDNKEITLLRNDGAIFVRFPELEIGRRFPDSEVLKRMQNEERDAFRDNSSIYGQPQIIAYEKLEDFPLVVVTTQNEKEVLKQWRLLSTTIIISLLILLSMLGVACLHAMRDYRQRTQLQNELQQLAHTDSLTGLANRRHFMELAEKELARAKRQEGEYAVLMLDLDHFKRINDNHGHGCGDRVLSEVARHLAQTLRETDIVGRIGGEEFAIVLPQADHARTLDIAWRLCNGIAAMKIQREQGLPLQVSVSIGAAMAHGTQTSLQSLLGQADRALYRAKNNGRNQVIAAWQVPGGC